MFVRVRRLLLLEGVAWKVLRGPVRAQRRFRRSLSYISPTSDR